MIVISKQTNGLISTILVSVAHLVLSGRSFAQVNLTAPEMIGRVIDHSITIHAEAGHHLDCDFEYGPESGLYGNRFPDTGYLTSNANEPFEITIDGLSADSRYDYRLFYRPVIKI